MFEGRGEILCMFCLNYRGTMNEVDFNIKHSRKKESKEESSGVS